MLLLIAICSTSLASFNSLKDTLQSTNSDFLQLRPDSDNKEYVIMSETDAETIWNEGENYNMVPLVTKMLRGIDFFEGLPAT